MSNSKTSTRGRGRTRNFATVVYPESAPENWRDVISDMHVAALISPLHDKDVNPDGTQKKPHYHVMFIFESVKEYETQVKPMFEKIGGVGREEINSARGYARYLCHMDNPEKYQYDPAEVTSMGGADFNAITHLPTDDIKTLQEIFRYIRTNEIYSLAELLDITAVNNPEWFTLIAMNRTYTIDKYIKSCTWEKESGYVRTSDRKE